MMLAEAPLFQQQDIQVPIALPLYTSIALDAIKTAFASPEGQACAADRKILAPNNDDVQIYLFDTVDV